MAAKQKVLIADDETSALKFMSMHLESIGCHVITALDGTDAINKFDEFAPDIVITDFSMPHANGLEVIKNVRERDSYYWTPIIVLSALNDKDNVISCLEAGADDYITKPVNLKILNAKIKTHSWLSRLQHENLSTKNSLEEALKKLATEEELAEKLLSRMLKSNTSTNTFVEYLIKPASRFSGDLVSIQSVNDNTYILIADSTGHGLRASLPTLIASEVFHHSLESTEQLEVVAYNLNEALHRLLPVDFFVAATLIKFNYNDGYIELWSGGFPDVLIKVDEEISAKNFNSDHLPLGILNPKEFDSSFKTIRWERSISVLCCSDGFFDLINHEQSKLNETMVYEVFNQTHGKKRLEALEKLLERCIEQIDFKDDITLLTLDM